ncbi:uncharacterized protein LOC144727507 [Lampetra planeri]
MQSSASLMLVGAVLMALGGWTTRGCVDAATIRGDPGAWRQAAQSGEISELNLAVRHHVQSEAADLLTGDETATSAAPTTEEPKTLEPATEEPKTLEPATEEPKTLEPATEEPKTLEPATEEPKTLEPATEEPKTLEPATEERRAGRPSPDRHVADGVPEARDVVPLPDFPH